MKKDYRNPLISFAAQAIDAFGWLVWSWSSPKKIDPLKVRRIVVVKFDRIGDSLLATPVLEALAKMYPHAELTAIVAPWNKEVFTANPFVRRTQVFEGAQDVHGSLGDQLGNRNQATALGKLIADIHPDIAVDLQGNPTIVLAMRAAQVPIRVGFGPKVLSFFLTHPAEYLAGMHQSEVYLSLARALGYDGGGHTPRLTVSPAVQIKAAKIFANFKLNKFIVLHLGSGRSYRQWPLEHFSELAQMILDKHPGWKIVLIGGAEDAPLAEDLKQKVGKTGRLVDFVGRLSLPGTHELLRHATAFVGSESGPMHIAATAGTPSVVMMNAWSGIERWQPLGESKQVLWKETAHRCAGPNCTQTPCPQMAAITVPEVYQALQNILSNLAYKKVPRRASGTKRVKKTSAPRKTSKAKK